MISFQCNQCGSRFSRPDSQSGVLIFCTCGNGIRVPWGNPDVNPSEPNSTETQPDPREIPDRHRGPSPEPGASSDQEKKKNRPSIKLPSTLPISFPTRRSRQFRKIDPDYCFNHGDRKSTGICSVCQIPLCNSCLVEFVVLNEGSREASSRGKQLVCGPCKNFQIAALGKPGHLSGPAVLSLILGLISAPVAMVLSIFIFVFTVAQESLPLALCLTLLSLLLPVGTLLLAWFAIREIEDRPSFKGQGLALTGFASGLISCLWVLSMGTILLIKSWQG